MANICMGANLTVQQTDGAFVATWEQNRRCMMCGYEEKMKKLSAFSIKMKSLVNECAAIKYTSACFLGPNYMKNRIQLY